MKDNYNNNLKLINPFNESQKNLTGFDPYLDIYHEFKPNHKNTLTGAEYPTLKNEKEKKIWEKLKSTHNCYAFAMGYKKDDVYFPQPGVFGVPDMHKHISLDREFTCSNYLSRMLMDNPHIYPIAHNKTCKKGYYKIYFTIAPNRDYHFFRQSNDGDFAHKPGATTAKITNSSNKIIQDPQFADRYTPPSGPIKNSALYYMTLCNSFCVPNNEKYDFPSYIE
jgi:hypothetical protein